MTPQQPIKLGANTDRATQESLWMMVMKNNIVQNEVLCVCIGLFWLIKSNENILHNSSQKIRNK